MPAILIQALFVYRAVRRYHLMSVDTEMLESVFERLFEFVRDGVVLIAPDGTRIAANRAIAAIAGGQCPRDASAFLTRQLDGYRSDETIDARRLRLRRSDGGEREVLVSQSPIGRAVDGGRIVLVRDITDQVRSEEERVRARQVESLGVLAAGLAHDFNNVLAGIVNCFGVLKTSGALSTEHREAIALGEAAALGATGLTRQLLTFAKGGQPCMDPLDIGLVTRETVRFALRGSTTVFGDCLPREALLVKGDRGQLSQVVHNIAVNAMQAMRGGGTLRIEGRERDGARVELVFCDTGPGIAPEALPRIFEPYFTTKPAGSGLGLATVFSIVKRHGGTVDVSNSPGSGARFVVTLDAAPVAALDLAQAAPLPCGWPPDCRVLVMDDEPSVRLLLTRLLEREGLRVDAAAGGEQALRLFDSARASGAPVTVAILDLNVPGGSGGVDVAREMKRLDPAVKLIASSGYTSDSALSDSAAHGFDGALPKPYGVDALHAVLSEVLYGSGACAKAVRKNG